MSVVKQSHIQQQRFFFQQQKNENSTSQDNNALSLVSSEQDANAEKSSQREVDTAHCAVLGYN